MTSKSLSIIQTFVQLGKALELEVVAEGIENEVQRDQLVTLGVDMGQGYLFSPPLDADALLLLLDAAALCVDPVEALA